MKIGRIMLNNVSTMADYSMLQCNSERLRNGPLPRQTAPLAMSLQGQGNRAEFVLNPTVSYAAPVRQLYPSQTRRSQKMIVNLNHNKSNGGSTDITSNDNHNASSSVAAMMPSQESQRAKHQGMVITTKKKFPGSSSTRVSPTAQGSSRHHQTSRSS